MDWYRNKKDSNVTTKQSANETMSKENKNVKSSKPSKDRENTAGGPSAKRKGD